MSHISTSRDSYLKNLCRKIETCEVTDGQKLVNSIVREEKTLTKNLHFLDHQKNRTLNQLENEIDLLKVNQTRPLSALAAVNRQESSASGGHDSGGFDVFSGREEAVLNRRRLHEEVTRFSRHNKERPEAQWSQLKANEHQAVSRTASPPRLQQRRMSNLRKNAPLSSSHPDLLNASAITGLVTQISPRKKEAKTEKKEDHSGPRKPSESKADKNHPNISAPVWHQHTHQLDILPLGKSVWTGNEGLRSPRVERKRSASLHEGICSHTFQDVREAGNSRQKPRASSLLQSDGLPRNVRGVVNHNRALRYCQAESHLANKHATSRSLPNEKMLCPSRFVTGKDAAKPVDDPNSTEALMSCRYLRIPRTATPPNESIFD